MGCCCRRFASGSKGTEMSDWADELFYAMDDLIASLTELTDDEELADDTVLQEFRDRLEAYRNKWGDRQ